MDQVDFKSFTDDKLASNRSFGITMSACFILLAFLFHKRNLVTAAQFAFCCSGIFLILSFFADNKLQILNVYWTRFGLLLGKIVTPLVLGVFFYLIMTPFGFLVRKFNLLQYKQSFGNSEVNSYWKIRSIESQNKEFIKTQF